MKKLLQQLNVSYVYAFLGEVTLAFTFIFFIVLARVLGPEQYGMFAAAVALGGILSFVIQFGFPNLLARDVAADPINGPRLTAKVFVIELINSGVVLLALYPIARAVGFEGLGIIVCYLVIAAEIGRSIKQTLRAILRGEAWFRAECISVLIERLAAVLIAGALLITTRHIVPVMIAIVITRLVENLGLVYYLNQRLQLWSAINWRGLLTTLKMGAPFAVAGVLWVIYYQIDLVMLKRLAIASEPGFYSAAYRIFEIFSALPRVFFAVFMTKFARCYVQTPEQLPQRVYQAIQIMVVAVLPLIIGAGIFQTQLVEFIYGEQFIPAIAPLAVILPTISINMFNGLTRLIVLTIHQERAIPPLLGVTLGINVGVNLLLIPSLGALGAALATLLSEVALFMLSLRLLSSIGYGKLGITLLKTGCIGLITAAVPSLRLIGLHPTICGVLLVINILLLIMVLDLPTFVKQAWQMVSRKSTGLP